MAKGRNKIFGRNAKPYLAYEHTIADVAACQAVAFGKATPEQQIRAYKWMIEKAAATYELPFFPGEPYGQDFMSGRIFVGQKLVLFTKVDLSKLKQREDPSAPLTE